MKEFDPIIGYNDIKKELSQIADMMRNASVYENLGIRLPYGLMLYGSPGVGKTLMANCLIKASGRKVFTCRKDKPKEEFIKDIRQAFEDGAANAPSIVFLDDMDKFANTDSDHTYAEEYVTVQSCIDQYKCKDVFILATVNDFAMLPSSLRRAGRFDRMIEVAAPNTEDAKLILAHYLEGKSAVSDINTEMLVRLMGGMSCASLETIINEAGVYAGYERSDSIKMEHFLKACLRSMFDLTPNSENDAFFLTDESKREKVITHEAGHVVVSEVLFPGSVTLAALNDNDGNCGGVTSTYYSNDSDIRWQKASVVTALAGMAAMENKFGHTGAGAVKDIKGAASSIKAMVENEGISGFGFIGYGYMNSEDLNHLIEIATSVLLNQYYVKAKEIIANNYEFLSAVIDKLDRDNIITMEDIEDLRTICVIKSVELG